jgi:predicted permease
VNGIVAMDISLPPAESPTSKAAQAIFFSRLMDRLRQIPGVRNVGATSGLPMSGGLPGGAFLFLNRNDAPASMDDLLRLFGQQARSGNADFCVATAGYFKVLGIPLLRGRLFDERDGPNSPHSAVISESLARDYWPHRDPIGHTIEFGNMDGDPRLLTIVGVVGDVRENGPDMPPNPTVYVNLFQRPHSSVSLVMLSDADTGSIAAAARSAVRRLNPEIPPRIRTLSQMYSAVLDSRKFNVILTAFFGIAALLLATTGVFGVMTYSVGRRTQEFGVRVALGAVTGNVVRLVLSLGLRTVFIGVAIGVAGSLALTRIVESLLFGVTAADPLTFCGVTVILAASALLACCIPARRATRVDPVVALRHE